MPKVCGLWCCLKATDELFLTVIRWPCNCITYNAWKLALNVISTEYVSKIFYRVDYNMASLTLFSDESKKKQNMSLKEKQAFS